jgi:hypothetical protein
MSLILEKFNTKAVLPDILIDEWKQAVQGFDTVLFDSLDHFTYTVAKLTQTQDSMCGVTYDEALSNLQNNVSQFPEEEQLSIRNLVRKNLFKRGLITEEVYENFVYTTSGTNMGVDVGKYAAGESDCVLSPAREYIDFFYELYVSVSYPCGVDNKDVMRNVAKLLATVEELERQHIYVKISTVLPIKNLQRRSEEGRKNGFFSVIPVFSHKDFKSVDVMSSVINDRLLRKFYFAVVEDLYGNNLEKSTYGNPMSLNKTINIGDELNEIELFEQITNHVGA